MSGTVSMGRVNVAVKDELGRNATRSVELTTKVAPGGEMIQAKTEDGRTVMVSRKLADLYPERYEAVKGTKKADD